MSSIGFIILIYSSMSSDRIDTTNPRYIKHPNGSSTMWDDGETLDAGSAIIIANNIAHRGVESCKHLVMCISPEIDCPQDDRRGYGADYTGVTAPSDYGVATDENQISWARGVAQMFGPFFIPADRDENYLRKVVVKLELYNASGTVYGYCYLTNNNQPPVNGYVAKSTFNSSATGEISQTVTLTSTSAALPNWAMIGQEGNPSVAVFRVYLWVGLRWTASGGNCSSISAFESR